MASKCCPLTGHFRALVRISKKTCQANHTIHDVRCTMYDIRHTTYNMRYAIRYVLYTMLAANYILYTMYYILYNSYIIYNILHTIHYMLYTTNYIQHTAYYIPYTILRPGPLRPRQSWPWAAPARDAAWRPGCLLLYIYIYICIYGYQSSSFVKLYVIVISCSFLMMHDCLLLQMV